MYKKLIAIIIIIALLIISISCRNNEPNTPEEVWGELERVEGGRVWDTLTEDQQALINYPTLNENRVYWTPSGTSYHSIDWCYTLEKSSVISHGTLGEAMSIGKDDPCSKCIGN